MREIKFRAWDNESEEYLPNVQNHVGNSDTAFGYMIKNDRYIIEQYTGLKDTKGKEIYAGDILEVDKDYPNFLFYKGKKLVVYFNKEKASFLLKEIPKNLWGLNKAYIRNSYLKIGNIHEK